MTRHPLARLRLVGAGAVLLAAVLSVAGVPITSAQGTVLFVGRSDGALPVDSPFDPSWDAVPPASVALSGQLVTQPMLEQAAFPVVRASALADDDRIAILLEWDDPSADVSTTSETAFADAAAVQIALGTGTSICMGQLAGGLNIWHWKADWAAEIAAGSDLTDAHPNMPTDERFPADGSDPTLTEDGFLAGQTAGNPRSAASLVSSVEDLSAIGFGTLTTQPVDAQNVHGASEHRGGVWRVVLSRKLDDGDPNDAALRPQGPAAVVAFALWDGSRGDRDGQKSVSAWLSLVFPPHQNGLLDAWPYLILLVLALGLSGIVMAYGARQPAVGHGWGPRGLPQGPAPDDRDQDGTA